jgi:hypothetical protein
MQGFPTFRLSGVPWLIMCLGIVTAGTWSFASDPAAPVPAPKPQAKASAPATGFKIAIAFYGLRAEPITTAELFFRGGVACYFASESPEEIVIINPADARVELLNLERHVQGELAFSRLEEKQAMLHRAVAGAIRKQEESGTRSNRIAAEMSRALNDPDLAETFDAAALRLRLTNSAVTVDATGAAEPDAARLAFIDTALTALVKLAAARDPEAIPPFIRLDSLRALIGGHHLRPVELAFTYRLAGPPRKHRWTYRLVETLTSREILALDQVTRLRSSTPFIPFERYERPPEQAKARKPAP